VYCEAVSIAKGIHYDEKSGSSVQRVHARVRRLEKAALAARTVAMIQNCKVVCDLKHDLDFYLQVIIAGRHDIVDRSIAPISPPLESCS